MSNVIPNLANITNTVIENDADFEVWHGKSQNGSVRTHMLLHMNGLPSVHIRFGDKKHGQRVSDITLAGNENVHVKYDDLMVILTENEAYSDWKRSSTNDGAEENRVIANFLKNHGNDKVSVSGEILDIQENNDNIVVFIESVKYLMIGEEVFDTESETFNIVIDRKLINEDDDFSISSDTTVVGNYSYPNKIIVV